jgi:hypothetical protein
MLAELPHALLSVRLNPHRRPSESRTLLRCPGPCRYFQSKHGWVFSAWCWSWVPVCCVLVRWLVAAGQWAALAFTPLWMWQYVVCAAMDALGWTAAYRWVATGCQGL